MEINTSKSYLKDLVKRGLTIADVYQYSAHIWDYLRKSGDKFKPEWALITFYAGCPCCEYTLSITKQNYCDKCPVWGSTRIDTCWDFGFQKWSESESNSERRKAAGRIYWKIMRMDHYYTMDELIGEKYAV